MKTRYLLSCCMVALCSCMASAYADDAARLHVLRLRVDAGVGLPEARVLAQAVSAEMEVAVETDEGPSDDPVLHVGRDTNGKATVTFRGQNGHCLGRSLHLPNEPQRAAETIALLAANLARNDAASLLGDLQPPKVATAVPLAHEPTRVLEPPPPATPTSIPDPVIALDAALPIQPVGYDVFPGMGFPPGDRALRLASLGFLGTYSIALSGSAVALGANVVLTWARGTTVALSNLVFGGMRGAQVGLANFVGRLDGGVQVGLANIAGSEVQGVQVGLGNWAAGPVRGAQVGLGNFAVGDVKGAQLGLGNFSGGDANVQIGLLNFGANANIGIGLLSLYWKGRTHLEASYQSNGTTLFDVKHGSRWFHQILAVGARSASTGWIPVLGYGIGARMRPTDRLNVDVDVLGEVELDSPEPRTISWLTQLRAQVGFRVVGKLSVFAGVVANVLTSTAGSTSANVVFGSHSDWVSITARTGQGVHVWPTWMVGVAFL